MLVKYIVYFLYLFLSIQGICYLVFYNKRLKLSKNILLFILFLFFCFCVYSVITPDWSSYKNTVSELYKSDGESVTNMEYVWRKLSVYIEGNIILFRMIIFLPAFFFLYKLVVLLLSREQYMCFLSLFTVFLLYPISGGRQILAVLMFYYGLFYPRKMISLILIVSSLFFHKIAVLFIIQYMISRLITKKWGFVLLIIFSLVALFNINSMINFLLDLSLENIQLDYYRYYLSDETIFSANIPGARRWIYASYMFAVLTILLILYIIFRLSKYSLSNNYHLIYNLLISSLFMIVVMFGVGYTRSSTLRFCEIQLLPLIFLISYYWDALKKKMSFVVPSFLIVYFAFVNVFISGCLI